MSGQYGNRGLVWPGLNKTGDGADDSSAKGELRGQETLAIWCSRSSDTSPWHLTYQTSGELVADLANREVECRFEGTGVAFGLGKQQAPLEGGEDSHRELVDIGVVM